MRLLREISEGLAGPATPEGGWNVGHLAHHGILLSCEGFSIKLDLDQLNALFDLAEDGESGEIRDHDGKLVFVEVGDSDIVLSRDDDETYPEGVIVDTAALKEMGIEAHEDATPSDEGDATSDEEQPEEEVEGEEGDDTIDPEADEEEELKEGVKRAFRRSGKKIKRGFRVTSGWRKGRVVSNIKNAYKPRPKAKTRLKLRIAAKKKKVIRILKGRITRRKPLSKRLVRMNKRTK